MLSSNVDLLAPSLPADGEFRQVTGLDASPDAGIVYLEHHEPAELLEPGLIVMCPEPKVPALLVVERRLAYAPDTHPVMHVTLLAEAKYLVVCRLLQLVVRDYVVLLVEDDLIAELGD